MVMACLPNASWTWPPTSPRCPLSSSSSSLVTSSTWMEPLGGSTLGHSNFSASKAAIASSFLLFLIFLWLTRRSPKAALNLLCQLSLRPSLYIKSFKNLMLVSFFKYFVPSELIASIFSLSDLVCLKAVRTLELVRGEGFVVDRCGAMSGRFEYNKRKCFINTIKRMFLVNVATLRLHLGFSAQS